MIIYTAYNPRMVGLGFIARGIHAAANTTQGLAILAIAGTDAALEQWQQWSDRTFGAIQPEILSAIESLACIVGWVAAMAWGYARLACTRTWAAWLEAAPARALALEVMGQYWEEARFWLSVAYSAVAVVVVFVALTGGYVLSNAPRWMGRAIGFALCVNWG